MKKLNKILVGIDFSSFSEAALCQGVRITDWNQSELSLLHVIDTHVLGDLDEAINISKKTLEEELISNGNERIETLLVNLPKDLPKLLTQPKIRIMTGTPVHAILRSAKDMPADLLVLGSNGSYGEGPGVGSLAAQCVRYSGKKVMLVRKTHKGVYKRITACVDFSDTSRIVVEQAIALAQQDRANLTFLHVFVPPWKILHYRAETPTSPDYKKQFLDGEEGHFAQFLKPFKSELANISWDQKVEENLKPGEGIIDYLNKSKTDIAVVGTRGRTVLGLFHLGTTAERIIQNSSCSVLMVKPHDTKYVID